MAFSKAKILRFNDIKSCAPAPGAYNPKYDDHVTGSVIYSKEKCTEPCSPVSSCGDAKSIRSANSVSNFRTPTVPRRRKPMPNSTGKLGSSVKLFSPLKSEALREKIVECTNKGETIRDLELQLEELKFLISQLKVEKDNLSTEKAQLLMNVEQVTSEFELEITELKESHDKETAILNAKLSECTVENQQINEEFNKMKAELKAKHLQEIKQLREDSEAKIRQFEENCLDKIKLAEIQMEEIRKSIELNWALKLQEQSKHSEEILQECQAISEFTVIQTEIEKNQLRLDLQEAEEFIVGLKMDKQRLGVENSQLDASVADLKTDMSHLIIELNDAREALGKEIVNREQDLDSALKEKHSYQVTLRKTHDTVNALKNRLLNSDRDVEQLKTELNNLEQSKAEELDDLKEQLQVAQNTNLELTEQNNALKSIETQVRSIETTLLNKVDDLRLKSQEERRKLTELIEDKQQILNELHLYIINQQKVQGEAHILINESKIEVERLESDNVDLKFKVSRLESTIEHMNNEAVKLNKKQNDVNEMKNIYRKYIEQSGKFDELQQKYEEMKQTTMIENEAIILHQARTIEKLRQDLAHSTKLNRKSRQIAPVDKENTPTKTIGHSNHNIRVDSPGKALKERN